MPDNPLLWGIAVLVVCALGGGAGYYLGKMAVRRKMEEVEIEAEQLRSDAQADTADLILKATKEALDLRNSAEEEVKVETDSSRTKSKTLTAVRPKFRPCGTSKCRSWSGLLSSPRMKRKTSFSRPLSKKSVRTRTTG
jgi:uncharacterized protein HemX